MEKEKFKWEIICAGERCRVWYESTTKNKFSENLETKTNRIEHTHTHIHIRPHKESSAFFASYSFAHHWNAINYLA